MKRTLLPALLAAAFLASAPGFGGADHSGPQLAQASSAAEVQLTEGTVKKVDKSAGKVTLAHGPLANLDMPAMTMVFRVTDAAWLDQMQAGDRIRFIAEQVGGALTVVRFEPVQ
ncbi:MAG: copper-binding protein [Betaproteobacteria bacterium]|nr:copper-binding protein [Betaproteobacteria bacterium]